MPNLLTRSLKQGRGICQALLSTFLTRPCPICQRATHQVFCLDCDRQLWLGQERLSAGSTTGLIRCPTKGPTPLAVMAAGPYSGALKRAILALKYNNRPDVAGPLGWRLGQKWQAQPLPGCRLPIVVPIPLHASRLQERGYNQAALIAENFCRATGLPLLETGLLRTQVTTAQHQLGAQARQQNLQGVFQVNPVWTSQQRARPVLLIDDIYTTGTTARAAARALTQAGIWVCGIGTVAKAILNRPQA